MRWKAEWQTQANAITFGRAAGFAIILLGVALSAWNAIDFDNIGISGGATEFRIRYFLQGALAYLGSGGLLIVAAEIADRLGWGEISSEQDVDDEQQVEPPA